MLRLKTRSQFQAVLAGNRLATSGHFAVHFLALSPEASSSGASQSGPASLKRFWSSSDVWLGSMVPKRWAKRAVTRNAIKRQVYQVAGEYEPGLPLGAFVVRLRTGFDKTVFASASSDALKEAVRVELQQLFAKICQAKVNMPIRGLVK